MQADLPLRRLVRWSHSASAGYIADRGPVRQDRSARFGATKGRSGGDDFGRNPGRCTSPPDLIASAKRANGAEASVATSSRKSRRGRGNQHLRMQVETAARVWRSQRLRAMVETCAPSMQRDPSLRAWEEEHAMRGRKPNLRDRRRPEQPAPGKTKVFGQWLEPGQPAQAENRAFGHGRKPACRASGNRSLRTTAETSTNRVDGNQCLRAAAETHAPPRAKPAPSGKGGTRSNPRQAEPASSDNGETWCTGDLIVLCRSAICPEPPVICKTSVFGQRRST
jgi:hypothetical protein